MLVQTFISKLAVETLDGGVLHRSARLDQDVANSMDLCQPSCHHNGRRILSSVRRGDVEIFLIDDRSYRDVLGENRKATAMLGKHQIQWLENALLRKRSAEPPHQSQDLR